MLNAVGSEMFLVICFRRYPIYSNSSLIPTAQASLAYIVASEVVAFPALMSKAVLKVEEAWG